MIGRFGWALFRRGFVTVPILRALPALSAPSVAIFHVTRSPSLPPFRSTLPP